ncbi:metal ABC transporter solute-binding protein, Zn/Mn family [Flexivirga caeni]|uniref:Cation ABC transporter substrate-binding protein n=1 Tax=Flexivirga caeni TaxID=2294115 RepID=A0A3M9MEG2_9MICO|nr:zinc ABC transporter substrate-binding protein [Flexivirga caeni]RNI23960.1 cation ABC transporter substrate-binding protein [Flexivirga caeni]
MTRGRLGRWSVALASSLALATLAACSSSGGGSHSGSPSAGGGSATGSAASAGSGTKIVAVGAENEYADVISQIGGKYVATTAIMSDPNTDPHTFEASAGVSKAVQAASLVVQNGVGYDDFMDKIEKASPNSARKVINVQQLRGLPDSTPNPHLWYDPKTMPAVAAELVKDLSAIQPAHAAYFQAQETTFLAALKPWTTALATFTKEHPNVPVATTEPVADYMLQAAGTDNKTPWSLQAAIMNGTDPSPQDVATQSGLFKNKQVKVFLYNQQVTDDITAKFLKEAHAAGIPVVGVYETMPTDGYTYQSWMLAELDALKKAVVSGTSTEKL